MNAAAAITGPRSINELRDFFAGICENRANLFADGILTLHETVDELQAIASRTGLVEAIGQDKVQEIIGGTPPLAPEMVELDGALEIVIALRTAEMVRDWELTDPRDRWRHTGESAPMVRPVVRQREPYAPPASTVAAFWHVHRLENADQLARWLADHPDDAPALYKIWKASRC